MDSLNYCGFSESEEYKPNMMQLYFKFNENDSVIAYGIYKGIYILSDTDINQTPAQTLSFKILDIYHYKAVVDLMFNNNKEATNVYIWRLEEDNKSAVMEDSICLVMSKKEWEVIKQL